MNPIETAILPIKTDAVESARRIALEVIARRIEKLEAAGWNLDVVAPRPDSFNMSRKNYLAAKAVQNAYRSITTHAQSSRRFNEPEIRARSPEAEERFVNMMMEGAAIQYDKFVFKLVKKIGDCDSAEIEGNHVWGHSILTVRKGENVERWKTQQIVNYSSLGNPFNQWPSRKIK